MIRKQLTKEQALQKLRQYCAYQERSHAEVIQKLWDLGVRKTEHDDVVATLIEEDYLNEERFAIAFAGGKFRMKDWGRKKILYALREKKVSEHNIKRALREINEEDYHKTLHAIAEKKWDTLESEPPVQRRKKLHDYLLQKGFESPLINEVINALK